MSLDNQNTVSLDGKLIDLDRLNSTAKSIVMTDEQLAIEALQAQVADLERRIEQLEQSESASNE